MPFVQRVAAAGERDRAAVEAIERIGARHHLAPVIESYCPSSSGPCYSRCVSCIAAVKEVPMPVADYTTYCEMLDRARAGKFAYPAVNVTSLTTANAVLKGLADSKSDGIIQVSTGGGAFASGSSGEGHGARRHLDRRTRPPRRRHGIRSTWRSTPTIARRTSWMPSSCRSSRRPNGGGRQANRTCSAATCSTAARCRSRTTSTSP